jgi:flagellar hook-basal body complex protein FliE
MSTVTMNATQAYAKMAEMANGVAGGSESPAVEGGNGKDFGGMLQDALKGAVDTGKEAEGKVVSNIAGKTDLVDVVTAVSAAEATLQTIVAVRDKVISAYQEISRMSI